MNADIAKTTYSVLLTLCVGSLTLISTGIAQDARYQVTFDADWSAATHPVDFPTGSAHFSRLVGGTHNSDVVFWEPGQLASDGIESMAETGGTSGLLSEVNRAVIAGTAHSSLLGPPLSTSPASASFIFDISESHPLVTLVTMIAPSPDWFVGVHGLNLMPAGQWEPQLEVDLFAYDAGTDSGATYRSPNANTNPAEPIALLSGFGDARIGTFTFVRLEPPKFDFNADGNVDVIDIDMLVGEIASAGNDEELFDLNGDSAVDEMDLTQWRTDAADFNGFSEAYLPGDANLDGVVNPGDLNICALNWQKTTAAWSACDFTADSFINPGDLNILALNWQRSIPMAASAGAPVPEPSAIVMMAFGLALVWRRFNTHCRERS